jgi:transcriptional regulator with XRE-family HTH domain
MKHITLLEARRRFRMPQRRERGITQQELEALSGVDRTRIGKMEADPVRANPTVDTVRRLEQALQLRRGTLVFGADAAGLASQRLVKVA